MASENDAGDRRSSRLDYAWRYATAVPGNKTATVCQFCGVQNSGGITRFKYHLSGTDPEKNVAPCRKVPPDVKKEIRRLIIAKNMAKGKKAEKMSDIRSELRQGLSRGDEDEDDDDDDEYIACPPDLTPEERSDYRAAVRASKASEWEREQTRQYGGSRGGSSSMRSGSQPAQFRRSQSGRSTHFEPCPAPALYKSADACQKRIKSMFSGTNLKEKLGKAISKFFIYDNLPPNKASSHHFKNMIACAQDVGPAVATPTPYEIKHKYLDAEYEEMQEYVRTQKKKWETYGCTIMADGWTGPTKLSIINFMVYSKGTTAFLKSVDASNRIKDHKYIYELLKDIVKEVGQSRVVQIVTDNGSAYVKAGRKLQERYNLYWTPCAAHCIDLILEEIGNRDNVKAVIVAARQITNFIYNHGWLLARVREVCQGDIVRPGATRFATNYIALESLYKKKSPLKQIFTSDEWAANRLSRTKVGIEVEKNVLDHSFWEGVQHAVGLFEPIYQVLRVVDTEVVPTMPILYDLIKVMKEKVQSLRSTQWVTRIIESRWDKTLSHPLHAAAYYLNPKTQYQPGVGEDTDLIQAVLRVYDKLYPGPTGVADFGNELIYFCDAKKSFGNRTAVAARNTMAASDWWVMHGSSAPTLKGLAVRVLAQTASSSACERNWSTFALIHTKQRNRLAYPKLEKLVFCYYNMKLRIRDLEAEADRVAEQEFIDLVDITGETDNEEGDQLYQWIRPAHLDDEAGNPDPQVAEAASEFGIDVDQVMRDEVGVSSSETQTGSSTDEDGSNDDGSGGGRRNDDHQDYNLSPREISPFTVEGLYTHSTQDADHGSRAGGPGIGAIGKDFTSRRGRNRGTSSNAEFASLSLNFDSMSVSTDREDLYPNLFPHRIADRSRNSAWTDRIPLEDTAPHVIYEEQQYNSWVNPNYPVYGQTVGRDASTYLYYLDDYLQNYANSLSWYHYCNYIDNQYSQVEPHRNSFWC